MIRFWGVLTVLCLIGAQAQALSCVRPNVAQTFNAKQAASETYALMVGTVKLTRKPPKYVQGQPRSAKALVAGRYVGRKGLSVTQTVPVTVQTHCAASWCGGFPSDMQEDVIMYLRQTADGAVIDIHACPNGFGQSATPERVTLLQKCLRRGKCSDGQIKRLEQD